MYSIPTVTIVKTTLDSAAASVTLTVDTSGLSFTAKHLLVRFNTIHTATAGETVKMRFNGDSGDNYSQQQFRGVDTTYLATQFIEREDIPLLDIYNTSDHWGGGEILIPDAFGTDDHKACVGRLGHAEDFTVNIAGRWANTAAITSVTLLVAANFAVGSTFELCVVDETFNINEQKLTSDGNFAAVQESGGNFPTATGDLVVISNVRASGSYDNTNIEIELNSDTTEANYEYRRAGGNGTTEYGGPAWGSALTAPTQGVCPGGSATANVMGGGVHHIPNYADNAGYQKRLMQSLTGHTSLANSNDTHCQRTGTRWNDENYDSSAVTTFAFKNSSGDTFKDNSMISTYRIPSSGDNYIGRVEASGGETTLTFDNISQNYDHLELSIVARAQGYAAYSQEFHMQFNDDTTGSNYGFQLVRHSGAAGGTIASTSTGEIIGYTTAAYQTGHEFSAIDVTIYNYSLTDRNKHFISSVSDEYYELGDYSKRWTNDSAITKIVLKYQDSVGSIHAYTLAELRGINKSAVTFIPEVRMF